MNIDQLNSGILYLKNPLQPFHGDHWYHTCEHFLSQHGNLSKSISFLKSSEISQIYIATSNKALYSMMSPFTFFILVLSVFTPQFHYIHRKAAPIKISLILINKESSDLYIKAERKDWIEVTADNPPKYAFSLQKSVDSRFSPILYNESFGNKAKGWKQVYSYRGLSLGSLGSSPVGPEHWISVNFDLNYRIKLLCDANPMNHDKYSIPNGHMNSTLKFYDQFQNYKKRQPVLLIYQRNLIRRLLGLDRLKMFLQSIGWLVIEVIHDERRSPCEVYLLLQLADVLLTTHGFQLSAIPMLRANSTLIEVFPYKYFKRSYVSLARSVGVNYHSIQSSVVPTGASLLTSVSLQSCMKNKICRSFARNQDIFLNEDEINNVIIIVQDVDN